jgi:hypothetical protein
MIKMELLQRIEHAIPDQSRHFVVHQDIPACQMDYVEKEIPSKWALAQTRLGLGEAVLNTAVCQISD